MEIISSNEKIRITDLGITEGFLGSVIKFDSEKLFISEPFSIHEFSFENGHIKSIIHDFETLSDSTITNGYILDFEICDQDKNLIAVAIIGIDPDFSLVFVYDLITKNVIKTGSEYTGNKKLIWQDGILFLKHQDSLINEFCLDTKCQNKNSNESKIYQHSIAKESELQVYLGRTLKLSNVNHETLRSNSSSGLSLNLIGKEIQFILDNDFSLINSIACNTSLNKFVIVLQDERHILFELNNSR